MTAGLAAMRLYDHAMVDHVNVLGARARRQIAEAIAAADLTACVTGGGSMFRIHFKTEVPRNYRESHNSSREARLLKALLDHAISEGIILIGTGSGTISTPMTNVEIDRLTDVLYEGFCRIRELQPAAAVAL
jgi:glutamate-1-semialdehyde 2,1-aminomutase